VGNTEQNKLIGKVEEEKLNRIAYLQNEIALLQQQMASLPPEPVVTTTLAEVMVEPEIVSEVEIEPQPATAIEAIPTSDTGETKSWFQTLKRFFLRTR
jgi:hypothetical protein